MTEQEELGVIDSLEKGPVALLQALSGVTEDLSQRAPGPEKWSILECVEHVALSEDYLFSRILAADRADSPLLDEAREARIVARGVDRSRPAKAPEVACPRGTFATLQDAIEHFLAIRVRTLQFARDHARDDLRCRITSAPPFGAVNSYEVLLLMAAHLFRHAKQIEEIKAAFNHS
jgi:hypothetical protein